ncbi:VWA domain-containing protein [Salinigranum halophilum]|uniref:VWA domain-containing protein n=1 Tax=Salinigranum halophilum TaxID=2565931 RepID=UPI0010A793ED|nr:VWA domain-containing protein [Salinigranum halophilum]
MSSLGRTLSKGIVITLCFLLISGMVAPVAATPGQTNRNAAMNDVLERTDGLSVKQQHATAAFLLGHDPATGARLGTSNGHDIERPATYDSERNPVDRQIIEQFVANISAETYPKGDSDRLFRNHSQATSRLRGYADRSPGLDTRLNTSTALLLESDRRLVERELANARATFDDYRDQLTPDERKRITSKLTRAERLLKRTDDPTHVESTTALLSERSDRFRALSTAQSLAVSAEDDVMQLSPISIEIESRGDPVRNGSSTVTRNISGTIEGAEPEDIDEVLVTVNDNQTVPATVTQGNSSSFTATVTLSDRVNTIDVSVTTLPEVTDNPTTTPETDPTTGGDTGPPAAAGQELSRQVPFGAYNATASEFASPASSSVTLSFVEQPITDVRVDSSAPAEDSFGEVQMFQFDSAPEDYSTTSGTFVAGFDVAVPASSALATAPADVEVWVDRSRLADDASADLTLARYDTAAGEWVRLDTTTQQSAETVTLRSTDVSGVSSLFAVVKDAEPTAETDLDADQQDAATAQADDQNPSDTAGTTTSRPTEAAVTEGVTTPEDEATSPLDPVIQPIFDLIDAVRDFLSAVTLAPIGTAAASRPADPNGSTVASSLTDGSGRAPVEQGTDGSVTRTAVLYLDGDGLTDTFETAVLNTSPLDPTSDIPGTEVNESKNELVDGAEDPDNDTLLNAGEAAIDADPRSTDTDSDGLSDGTESRLPQFNATLADTNGDGVLDGESDPDGDGLTTAAEVNNSTDPSTADTDADGLSDGEELDPSVQVPATDPTRSDTDDDLLTDSEERNLGTNPTVPDTDGDGTLDGNETFTTASQNTSVGTTVEITGKGNVGETVTIAEGGSPSLNTTTVREAQASPVVDLETQGETGFSSANVSIDYDPDAVGDESALAVYRLNRSTGTFRPLNSTVDKNTNTVTATTDEFSRFVVFNVTEWESNFDAIEPPNIGDDQSIAPVDAAFILDSSGSMGTNDPNDLRLQAAKEFTGALLDIDRAAVVDFDFDADIRQRLTSDFQAVNRSIDTIDSRGGTSIGAGVRAANREYSRNSDDSRSKIAILLTDGRGSGGLSEAETASDQNVTIYTIGLSNAADASKLRSIASKTGGNYTQVSRAADLPDVFSRIAETTQSADSDGDGLDDATEIGGYRITGGTTPVKTVRTDPFDPDTDNDGIPDGQEAGTKKTVTETVNVAASGVSVLDKQYERTYFESRSDPTSVDSDGDGLPDADEYGQYTTKYTNSASDTKAFKQTTDVSSTPNLEINDVSQFLQTRQSSPSALSADTDDDGIDDGEEITIGTDPTRADTDGDHITDGKEQNLTTADPTLFDERQPDIKIKSLSVNTVADEEGDLTDVFDTKYTVTYTVKDPAGVSSVIVERGDDHVEVDHSGTEATNTVSVVAESFLAQGSQFLLGARVDVKVEDRNNNTEGFVAKSGPDLYDRSVKAIGNTLPNFFSSPVFGLAVMAGFVKKTVGAINSFIDLLTALLANPGGSIAQAIETLEETALAIMQRPIDLLKAYAGTIRSDMLTDNPFSSPSGTPTVLDGLTDSVTRFNDGVQVSDFSGLSDFVAYGLGWYAGYFGADLVAKLIGAVLAIPSGGSSLLISAASTVANLAGKVVGLLGTISKLRFVGAASDFTRAARAVEQVDRFDPAEFLVGLRSVSKVRAVEVVDIVSNDIAVAPNRALDVLADNLVGVDSGAARYLSRYVATTGSAGAQTLAAAQNAGRGATTALLSDTTTPVSDRVLTSELTSGEQTQQTVGASLQRIDDQPTAGEQEVLATVVSSAGSEGVTFLSADDSQAEAVVSRVQQTSGAEVEELASLVLRAGGENVTAAVQASSPQLVASTLTLDQGAAAGARANLIEALAQGEVNATAAAQFVTAVNARTTQQQKQVLNRLAFTRNATETGEVVEGFNN